MKKNAKKPIVTVETYLKYGFVVTEHQFFYCPQCKRSLTAGPSYQPNYCEECGQRLNFSGIKWKEERMLGYAKRGEACEQVKN